MTNSTRICAALVLCAGSANAAVLGSVEGSPLMIGLDGSSEPAFIGNLENGSMVPETPAGVTIWVLDAPVELGNGATLDSATAFYQVPTDSDDDPTVTIGFSVTAGATPTVFTFMSATASTPLLDPAFGVASYEIGISDNNGDGASLTAPGGLFDSIINPGPGESIFATLGGSFSTPFPFSSADDQDRDPALPIVRRPVGTGVTSIKSEVEFELSAFDTATGSFVFNVESFIPTPGTTGLLAVSALAFARRRR